MFLRWHLLEEGKKKTKRKFWQTGQAGVNVIDFERNAWTAEGDFS